MAIGPIMLFSPTIDPMSVVQELRNANYEVRLTGSEQNWSEAKLYFAVQSQEILLFIFHRADYYTDPNWTKQISFIRSLFERFPKSEQSRKAVMLTSTWKFAISFSFEPDELLENDPRLAPLYRITELLDGVLFTPEKLLDTQGKVLCSVEVNGHDLESKWPKVTAEVDLADFEREHPNRTFEERFGDDSNPVHSASRVAKRALVLTALSFRAMLDHEQISDESFSTYNDLLDWVKKSGIQSECEPDEKRVVECPISKLGDQVKINSIWRLEGLSILGWALGRFPMLPIDVLVNSNQLWDALCLLDVPGTLQLLKDTQLRPTKELQKLRRSLFAAHWRLTNFRINSQAMDFATFAKDCWFGPLYISDLPMKDSDLAIGGKRIDLADPELVANTNSAVLERHLAVNWLLCGPNLYSETDVST